MQREKYEWARLWWENADNDNQKRVLIIGDSISVGYRDGVQKLFGEDYAVDLLATSKAIDDKSFITELDYMLSQYSYEAIHFNNGIHGLHMDIKTYEVSYRFILNRLKIACDKVMVATSTPATAMEDHTKYSPDNEIISQRNQVVLKLAKEYNIPVNDLYSAMDGKAEYKRDSYHYESKGIEEQEKLVKEAICKFLAFK